MKRFRPYRKDQQTRDAYAEVSLKKEDLIYPYFIIEGEGKKKEVPSLEHVYHFTLDQLIQDMRECLDLGINKFLLFGVITYDLKTSDAQEAAKPDNLVSRAVSTLKQYFPEALIFTDVCLCGYTDHGHCGIIEKDKIKNDRTLPLLAEMALSHAQAGADYVAPSSMMDGQVKAIREHLDANGYTQTGIMGYSAKFASDFYGPFRDAGNSSPSFGDRKTYQMDYRVTDQALDEIRADIEEGADWTMVKPAHTYLDIIARAKTNSPEIPLAAYHVSGEYMMIKQGAKAGIFDEQLALREVLFSLKRAGADYIITYFAKQAANYFETIKL